MSGVVGTVNGRAASLSGEAEAVGTGAGTADGRAASLSGTATEAAIVAASRVRRSLGTLTWITRSTVPQAVPVPHRTVVHISGMPIARGLTPVVRCGGSGRAVTIASMHVMPPLPPLKRVPPGVWTVLAWWAGLVFTFLIRIGLPGESGPAELAGPFFFRWDGLAWLVVSTVLTHVAGAQLRRRPLTAMGLLLVAAIFACVPLGVSEIPLAQFLAADVALSFIAAERARRTGIVALLGALTVLAGYLTTRLLFGWPAGTSAELAVAMTAVIAWLVGHSVRQAREHAATLIATATAQAVTDERLRISRELHDTVAHSIGVIALQAGAARRVIDTQPARAGQALGDIETVGRETLSGLRHMLGVLRQSEQGQGQGVQGQGQGMRGQGVQDRGVPSHGVQGDGVQGHGVKGHGVPSDGEQGQGKQGQGKQGYGVQDHGVQGQGGEQDQGVQDHGVQDQGEQGYGVQGQGVQVRGMQGYGMRGQGVQDHGAQDHGVPRYGQQGHGEQGYGVQGQLAAVAPGLSELDRLVAMTTDAGVHVEVRRLGERRPLPPEIDVSAYRIIQEAITNVVRHAGTSRCRVSIDYRDDELAVEILDEGRGPRRRSEGGYGLVGMRERANLLRGSFSAGPRAEGGFRVAASLPLSAEVR
ncbi:sensor histidine kinase [Nonomuraea fuscirosea]|uniref:sensor histidine kinase n=1 Tax=Nonomuraea fuscirosea TaxID=1291556 RepID=UPI0033D2DE8D